MTNVYNREFHGMVGKTVEVSVASISDKDAKQWVEVVEHIFLEETVEGGHWVPGRPLPMYPSIRRQL